MRRDSISATVQPPNLSIVHRGKISKLGTYEDILLSVLRGVPSGVLQCFRLWNVTMANVFFRS